MLTPAAIASAARRHLGVAPMRWMAAAGVAALAAGCSATEANHPLRGPSSFVGWATTAGEPKDFVKARRTGAELAYVPIGRVSPDRPTPVRSADAARSLEAELDRQRDESDNFARRTLPSGAYGQPLPSVTAPPKPGTAAAPERPTPGQPESYPVSASRLRQIRENAQRANQN